MTYFDFGKPGHPKEGRTLARHLFCQKSLLLGSPPDDSES